MLGIVLFENVKKFTLNVSASIMNISNHSKKKKKRVANIFNVTSSPDLSECFCFMPRFPILRPTLCLPTLLCPPLPLLHYAPPVPLLHYAPLSISYNASISTSPATCLFLPFPSVPVILISITTTNIKAVIHPPTLQCALVYVFTLNNRVGFPEPSVW